MTTLAQFATKGPRFAAEVANAERRIIEGGALLVKRSVQNQLAAAGVQGGRLRGVGKRGARIGVRYNTYPHSAKVLMFGPAQLIESDTKAHRIPRQRKTTRGRKRYIVIPGVGVRAHAEHPGTRGKHPWRKGVNAALPRIGPESQKHLHQALVNTLR